MASSSSSSSTHVPFSKALFDVYLSEFLPRSLAVFDFDNTIINSNSDLEVMKIIDSSKYPPNLDELHKADGWIAYMQKVFEILHANNITQAQIADFVKQLAEVPQMKHLIEKLYDNGNFDIIIISDANTFFINVWLEANNLSTKVAQVFSNPAEFNDAGMLQISMYHVQDECKLSTRNLCKGRVLQEYMLRKSFDKILYDKVFYIGDGQNDLCPILKLDRNGVACCRENFKLIKLVRKVQRGELTDNGTPYVLKAEVLAWNTGNDILEYILHE